MRLKLNQLDDRLLKKIVGELNSTLKPCKVIAYENNVDFQTVKSIAINSIGQILFNKREEKALSNLFNEFVTLMNQGASYKQVIAQLHISKDSFYTLRKQYYEKVAKADLRSSNHNSNDVVVINSLDNYETQLPAEPAKLSCVASPALPSQSQIDVRDLTINQEHNINICINGFSIAYSSSLEPEKSIAQLLGHLGVLSK